MRSLLLLCALAAPLPLRAQSLELALHGRSIARATAAKLSTLAPVREVEVYEPHEQANRRYVGVDAQALFQAIYGAEWQNAEEVVFTCADGYKAAIPAAKLRQFRAYLAFKKPTGPFALRNRLQNDERVQLGPFYLVWDNVAAPELRAYGGMDWPYQVRHIDLVRFAERAPRTAPPAGAPPVVQRGFVAFRSHCLPCHTINGEGGDKAPELNYPTSVTEYFDEPWLRRWIERPTSIRFNTKMPGLDPQTPRRDALVADIVAYLRAMAAHKRAPGK